MQAFPKLHFPRYIALYYVARSARFTKSLSDFAHFFGVVKKLARELSKEVSFQTLYPPFSDFEVVVVFSRIDAAQFSRYAHFWVHLCICNVRTHCKCTGTASRH